LAMTDKDLKKLRREDLIEIILQLQENEQQLNGKLEEAQKQLNDKNLKISEAGSIAEAVAKLNGLFEAAQATADDYVAQVRLKNADVEGKCDQMLVDAAQKSAQMVQEATLKSERLVQDAAEKADKLMTDAEAQADVQRKQVEDDSQRRWEAFQAEANKLISAHAELEALLKR
jgi:hypothetical protein